MKVYCTLFAAAAANVVRYRVRSAVIVLCLVAICGPYVTGIAISEGVRADAELSVEEGADLYLTLDQFGRNGPIPMKYLEAFRQSPFVLEVVPRIVGRAQAEILAGEADEAESELVVILGLEPMRIRRALPPVADSLPQPFQSGDVILGAALASHLGAQPGEEVSLKVGGVAKRFRLWGVFRRDASIWSAQVVCMNLGDAASLFALPGYASDFLIYCRPGPENIQGIRRDAFEVFGDVPYRLQSKQREVKAYVDMGFRHQQGVFTVLFLVAFAVGIPALLVASGLGLSDRRREIGISKAVGWRTTDVMIVVMFEQLLLSVVSACLAVLASFVWVRMFNGAVVAQFFIGEIGSVAPFQVPARFTPAPAAVALLLCLTITLAGSLLTTWRLATHSPAETIR